MDEPSTSIRRAAHPTCISTPFEFVLFQLKMFFAHVPRLILVRNSVPPPHPKPRSTLRITAAHGTHVISSTYTKLTRRKDKKNRPITQISNDHSTKTKLTKMEPCPCSQDLHDQYTEHQSARETNLNRSSSRRKQ